MIAVESRCSSFAPITGDARQSEGQVPEGRNWERDGILVRRPRSRLECLYPEEFPGYRHDYVVESALLTNRKLPSSRPHSAPLVTAIRTRAVAVFSWSQPNGIGRLDPNITRFIVACRGVPRRDQHGSTAASIVAASVVTAAVAARAAISVPVHRQAPLQLQ